MSFTSNKPYFTHPTFGSIVKKHNATFLRRTIADGYVKLYDEGKSYNEYERRNHGAERMEISIPEGKVVVLKDYKIDPKELKYTDIECYSKQDELLETIGIVQETLTTLTPQVKFYSGSMILGRGWGDIGIYIAQKLLGDGVFDPRYVAGSHVDTEVMNMIFRLYHRTSSEQPDGQKNLP